MRIRLNNNDIQSYLLFQRQQTLSYNKIDLNRDWIFQNRFPILFHACGISNTLATQLMKSYGEDLLRIIENDPFQLYMNNEAVNFRMAAQLWRRTTKKFESSSYAKFALYKTFTDHADNKGDIYLDKTFLINSATTITNYTDKFIRNAYDIAVIQNEIYPFAASGVEKASLQKYLNEEIGIAGQIKRLQSSEVRCLSREEILSRIDKFAAFPLDDEQKNAVVTACQNKISIITGGPGTGKSALIRIIDDILHSADDGLESICVSLAAKIARAIHMRTQIAAETIHSALEYSDGVFTRNQGNHIESNVIYVEEAFMLDNALLLSLLKGCSKHARIIIIGDNDQLEPIGRGNPIKALMDSGSIPAAKLITNHRSGTGSSIPQSGKLAIQGKMPLIGKDIQRIPTLDDSESLSSIVQAYNHCASYYGKDNVQVLAAMHHGRCGTTHINNAITQSEEYSVGDRVIQLKNDRDSDFFNGELGTITEITHGHMVIVTDGGSSIEYKSTNPPNLAKAYCISYHKSQGLEYPVVINLYHPSQKKMLNRNIVNVGITRAREKCIIIDQKNQLAQSLSISNTNPRRTLLDKIIRNI
jgi:exodeoxyribonuclease V alpha subunit